MMRSFCQLLGLILLLVVSACSRQRQAHDESLLSQVEPKWFSAQKNLSITRWQGEIQTHLFFDAVPELSNSSPGINFIPLSSDHGGVLDIDVLSGQRFFSHFTCGGKDVWKEGRTIHERVDYVQGFIPRVLNQRAQPQKIIVFGNHTSYDLMSPALYRTRIVGSAMLETCPRGHCLRPEEWRGELLLIGVDPHDPKLSDTYDTLELATVIDWKKVQAQLENLDGYNQIGTESYPALRVGNLVRFKPTMEFLLSHAVLLNTKELSRIQASCLKVYDELWTDAGEVRPIDAPATTSEEVRKRMNLEKQLRLKNLPTYFNQRLSDFFKRKGAEFATCSRLVYPGNPNENEKKFRFLSWVSMFARLHKEGWEYDCRLKAWDVENRGAQAMKTMTNSQCSMAEYDRAFNTLPSFLKHLQGISGQRYRFIGWDEHGHGTHAKIFSWVDVPERQFDCSNGINAKIREKWKETPEEFSWENRDSTDRLKNGGFIL